MPAAPAVQVTNEEAVLGAIREVLRERGRGEQLLLFDPVSSAAARRAAPQPGRSARLLRGRRRPLH